MLRPRNRLGQVGAITFWGRSLTIATLLATVACNQVTVSPSGADSSRPEPSSANSSGTDPAGTDLPGTDPAGTDPSGTRQYDATATVIYTWQAAYTDDGVSQDRPNDTRIEKFESVSLVNHNGTRPGEAVTGPDEKGLWWPALPPKPTVDDLEARAKKGERAGQPELIKSVDYAIAFDKAGEMVNLPTDYQVYRQAVKAYPEQRSLLLTLGPNDGSVINAEIQ
ncbi:MAG: hypothetical protein AAF152_02215 [Cyanobacteria bacterium P01_A01_bin.114]